MVMNCAHVTQKTPRETHIIHIHGKGGAYHARYHITSFSSLTLTFASKVPNFPGNFGCIGESASGKIITNCKIAINAAQCTAGAERRITGKVNFTSLRWKQPVTAFNYVMVGTENINGSEVAHRRVRVTIMYDMI